MIAATAFALTTSSAKEDFKQQVLPDDSNFPGLKNTQALPPTPHSLPQVVAQIMQKRCELLVDAGVFGDDPTVGKKGEEGELLLPFHSLEGACGIIER